MAACVLSAVSFLVTFGSPAPPAEERSERTRDKRKEPRTNRRQPRRFFLVCPRKHPLPEDPVHDRQSLRHQMDCRDPNTIFTAEINNWRSQKILLKPTATPSKTSGAN